MKNSMYVRCIENRQFIHQKGEPPVDDEIYGLTIGKVYKRISDRQAEQHGMIRVIDESFGEPGSEEGYMYPSVYFEPLDFTAEELERITLQVPAYVKDILHAEAVASNMSVSAFLRKWIDEHLDLPDERLPEVA